MQSEPGRDRGELQTTLRAEKLDFDLLCELAARRTGAEITALYRYSKKNGTASRLSLAAQRGIQELPARIAASGDHIGILEETGKALVVSRQNGPFKDLLLLPEAASALAIYVEASAQERGILIINSRRPLSFSGKEIELIEELVSGKGQPGIEGTKRK